MGVDTSRQITKSKPYEYLYFPCFTFVFTIHQCLYFEKKSFKLTVHRDKSDVAEIGMPQRL